jgi:hypothetical protein
VKLDAIGANAQLCCDAVHILMRLMSISAHWLATSTRPAWELTCRTVPNRPYTGFHKALELLACFSEHCATPAVLGDTLCQTIQESWAVRCEMRLPHAPVAVAHADVDMEATEEEGRDEEHGVQSSSQSLPKCKLAVYHTLPAAVRHVHPENMVPWAQHTHPQIEDRAPGPSSSRLS